METLLNALQDPAGMSGQQWLLVVIMVSIIVGSAYFVFRLYRIILRECKSTYVPNIGRARLRSRDGNAGYSGRESGTVQNENVQDGRDTGEDDDNRA